MYSHNRKHQTNFGLVLMLITVLFCGWTATAHAGLAGFGETNPTTGFPDWYVDSNNLALQLCLDNNGMCLFDPVIPEFPHSVTSGFGAEAFWWLSEASITTANGGGILVMAMEAAYANEDPVVGDQFPFGRLRIRIDVPNAGHYVVTHPFGVHEFDVDTPGVRAINFSSDIGSVTPDFSGPLGSDIGPYLTWDSDLPIIFPEGEYIGNPNILHTVTGSPFNTNVFRVEGPGIGGPGVDVVETDLFAVQGKITLAEVPVPIRTTSATYSRTTTNGQVDLFINSLSTATMVVSGAVPATQMASDGNGNFFTHLTFDDPVSIPSSLTITGTDPEPLNIDNVKEQPIVDMVKIIESNYQTSSQELTIQAKSSDEFASPTLTAQGFGNLIDGTITAAVGTVPPGAVTINSSRSGSNRSQVTVDQPGPVPTDTTPPLLTVPADVTVTVDSVPTAVTLGIADASDAESGIVFLGNSAPALFGQGSVTVVWTAVNGAGLISTANQIVTVNLNVVDNPPVINGGIALPAVSATEPFGAANLVAPSVTDDNPGVALEHDAPAVFPLGLTTVTWTATDSIGQFTTATQSVTVNAAVDATPPTITAPPNVNVTVPSAPAAVVIGAATASDPESGIFSIVSNAPAQFNEGTTTVIWTATNGQGLTATAQQLVTVTVQAAADTTPPVVTPPANVNVNVPSVPAAVSIGTATAVDPESGVVSITSNAPALFPAGPTTVTWTAVNGQGLIGTATQIVTVTLVDVTPPVVVAPANVNVTVASAPTAVNIGVATASDPETGIASIVSNAPAQFNAGTTTVTWTATNGQGLTATAQQLVTVTVQPAADPNRIVAFELYNADTNQLIGTLGNSFSHASCGNCALNIRAVAFDEEGATQSIFLNLDNGAFTRSERGAPYTLGGDTAGDFFDLAAPFLGVGNHNITATPYSQDGLGGTQGTPLTLNFTITP